MKVELIAYTPNPDGLANLCAETCVSKTIPTIKTSANGLRSLQEALDSRHESVIEHASFTFAVSGVSRALTHQLVRHRIASYSQQSQRYVDMSEATYIIPESIDKCLTPATPDGCPLNIEYVNAIRKCEEVYRKLVDAGVPPGEARYVLPNACTTNIIVTMNARSLMNFFAVRCCERAQSEIKELAYRMLELVKDVAPTIFENAGPSCEQLGYCPEKRSCGQIMKLSDMIDIVDGIEEESSIRDEQRTAERECHRCRNTWSECR